VTADVWLEPDAEIYQGDAYLERHFRVQTQYPVGGGGADLGLYFTSAEFNSLEDSAAFTATSEDDVSSISGLGTTKYDGPTEDDVYDPSDATGLKYIPQMNSGNDLGQNFLTVSVDSFSEFWIHGNNSNSPLPVELLDFDATPKKGHVLIEWATATETGNKAFEVQRSADGSVYTSIARVEGEGTSVQAHHYSLKDEDPLKGLSYYRLKQIDRDGELNYSKPVAVRYRGKDRLRATLYPNPSGTGKGEVLISGLEGKGELRVEVRDMRGRKVLTEDLALGGRQRARIELRLPEDSEPGIYFVRLRAPGGELQKKWVLR
jgi:hypothetical protein